MTAAVWIRYLAAFQGWDAPAGHMDGGSPELFFATGDRVIEGELQPQSTTQKVAPAFFAGPWDGLVERPVDVSDVLGRIRERRGTYQFSGFRPTNKFDLAVYVWEAK